METTTIGRCLVMGLMTCGLAAACNGTTLDTPTSATPTAAATTLVTATAAATLVTATTCTTGDGVNDACSCDADAHAYCGGFYTADWASYAREHGYTTSSWKYGLLDCLGKQTVSAACTASLARRETLNSQMMSACQSYCRGTTPQPGAEPCVDRLKSLYDSLDNACRIALDAHEAAKAITGRTPF